jgi:predicted cupin superfamily sugar epimerase
MAPGFDARDYEGGVRRELLASYPDAADVIRTLTRA